MAETTVHNPRRSGDHCIVIENNELEKFVDDPVAYIGGMLDFDVKLTLDRRDIIELYVLGELPDEVTEVFDIHQPYNTLEMVVHFREGIEKNSSLIKIAA